MKKIPKRYVTDIEKAKDILKEFGVSEIFIFGSLTTGKTNRTSDIDLAVRGLSADKYFRAYSKLAMKLEHEVDLISLDDNSRFTDGLLKSGGLMRVS